MNLKFSEAAFDRLIEQIEGEPQPEPLRFYWFYRATNGKTILYGPKGHEANAFRWYRAQFGYAEQLRFREI